MENQILPETTWHEVDGGVHTLHSLDVLDTVWWLELELLQPGSWRSWKVHRFTRLDTDPSTQASKGWICTCVLLALIDRLPKAASFSDGSEDSCRLLLRQSWYATHTRYIVVVMVLVLLVELVVVMMVLQLSYPTLALRQWQSIHKASFTRRTLYSVHTVEEYFNENVRKGRKSAGSTNIFLAPRQICLLTMEINAQTNLSELLLGVLFYKSIGIK